MSYKSNFQDLISLFKQQPSWQDRYRQIIQLAKTLPTFPTEWKTLENQIQGCENKAWLYFQYDSTHHTLQFYADSEGRIVKGLLAILVMLTEGKSPQYIADCDFWAILKEMNVIEGLSQTRQLGLTRAIERIHQIAQNNLHLN